MAPRELQITRVIIAHHPETIAAAGRVLRLERGRVLGSEAADPSLLGAAALLKQLKLLYALRDVSAKRRLPILPNIRLRKPADG